MSGSLSGIHIEAETDNIMPHGERALIPVQRSGSAIWTAVLFRLSYDTFFRVKLDFESACAAPAAQFPNSRVHESYSLRTGSGYGQPPAGLPITPPVL